MKKLTYLIIAIVVFSTTRLAFAQEMRGQMMGGEMQEKGRMGQGMQGMKEEGMMQMHGMMGKATMVSSEDGGVIIMIGKTLYKYDKDLNLVKQVELPIEGPQDKMREKMADKEEVMEKK